MGDLRAVTLQNTWFIQTPENQRDIGVYHSKPESVQNLATTSIDLVVHRKIFEPDSCGIAYLSISWCT